MRRHFSNTLSYISLPVVLILTLVIYWPGLSGTFLLDDIPNLVALGNYADYDEFSRIMLFLLSGDSGPTGRPIALLSFYMNDNGWPASPFTFKYTNLLIHVLNGVFVFWLTYLLLRSLPYNEATNIFISSTTSLLWLLHPLQVSTTLYVIQRMTELSALFTLAALIVWLYGRDILLRKNRVIVWRILLLVPLFGILAILSKENGVLIPVYILGLEVLQRGFNRNTSTALDIWIRYAAAIPSVLLFSYIFYAGSTSGIWLLSRPFTFSEHLLSEFHALAHYLSQIVLPRLHGMGLFHDDFPISTSLLEPIETLFSVTFLLLLALSAWFLRYRIPAFSFAIAWFFAGHLIESTFMPLELYFEHRNYLAMYGIIFFMVWGTHSLASRYHPLPYIFLSLYTIFLIIMTYSNTRLWGQPLEAAIVWSDENPSSIRAQMTARSAINIYAQNNRVAGERLHLQRMLKYHPDRITAQVAWLDFLCKEGQLTTGQIRSLAHNFESANLHITDISSLQSLFRDIMNNNCTSSIDYEIMLDLLSSASKNSTAQYPQALNIIHRTYAMIYTELGYLDKTIHHLEEAYKYAPSVDLRLEQVLYLQSAGLHTEALNLLNRIPGEIPPLEYRLRHRDIDRFISISRSEVTH